MQAGENDSIAAPDVLGELEEIAVEQIVRNERNPRQTFRQETIERLATSISEVGLLVPITVYHDPKRKKTPYVLLDGECRLRAFRLSNREKIQALIVPKPSAKENAVRMFNIHMLREDWKEIETAWALQQIMEETGVTTEKDLQKMTGLSVDRIRNMKRVLQFPKQYQQMVAEGELPYQLLVEIDKNILAKRRAEIADSRILFAASQGANKIWTIEVGISCNYRCFHLRRAARDDPGIQGRYSDCPN